MTDQPSSTVVIVTYASDDVLPECLKSIPLDVDVVIVDQSLTVGGVRDQALRYRSDATVLAAGRNRGFGAGCNLGAANAAGDVLIFLNPDARFVGGACARLARAAACDGAVLVGPRIIDESGCDVTRARNWSSVWPDTANLLVPASLLPRRWHRNIPRHANVYSVGGDVPYVQGACMAMPRRLFTATGGFDEEFFLYGEEEWLARRVRALGGRVILEPQATVLHVGHISTAQTGTFAVEQYYRSVGLMYRRTSDLQSSVSLFRGALRGLPVALALFALLVTAPARAHIGYRKRETASWCRFALLGLSRGLLRRPTLGPNPVP